MASLVSLKKAKKILLIFMHFESMIIMNIVTNTNDGEAIRKAIMDYYHEGHVKADPALYEKIFLDEWKFFLHNDEGKLRIVDKSEYYSWYNPDEVDENLNWKTEIDYVDVTGKIGAAKIRIGNQNVQFTDYFNLMKIDEGWWIVHKISTKD
ncbi:MAG: nuclear transport factor 2 family protein [Candidatus Kariarchaeaceae archaeon]|jgi:hypothetical protein